MYNVGHDTDHSLLEVAHIVRDAAPADVTITVVPWPAEHQRIDIGSFHTDGGKIRRELGWQARVSLDDGIRDTLAFYAAHPWYLSST
jgi:nucleoside-diphosphate-sugar epimerase